tara:strand:+ start:163 stop:426 length:264 start_codon:yes stop_codon:yes gene_type:complete
MINRKQLSIEQGKRVRTCHTCKCSIPKHEWHVATYRKSDWNWWSVRENTCVLCLEFTVKVIKHFIYKNGGMKNRRNLHNAQRMVQQL